MSHPRAPRPPDGAGEILDERWVPTVPLADVPDEGATHVEVAGVPVCLARSGGVVYAILDECSHGRVRLSEGEVADGAVECWLHGSTFDLGTGAPKCPPATASVPVYPVRVVADVVEVAVPPPAGGGGAPSGARPSPSP
ncbi:3-phenylpropionate/trans-cinnamate dioxygenase ferredoxin subunit [Phycicoccus duodecadis]|uniref:3-phenylpropionate/trans-cinnamate dioxygenase ferredoxin subunit n=1 Tax=Phycicoccus duodecadis TaxID=173053 RepID=A0A2N3YHN1_9MICO|nr:3-phenylpropionate/trans-cinnamate dioxygenase ferredoxin subunit [Phycicoccus duodecadis]